MSDRSSVEKIFLKGAVIFNPVLIQLAGICPVAAVSADLITAFIFTVVFTLITVFNCVFASVFLKKIPRWFRVAVYGVFGLLISCFVLYGAEKAGAQIAGKVYLYLPLLALNSVTAVHCEQFSVKHNPKQSLLDALAVSVGFGGVILLLGILRELLGNGSLAGFSLPVNHSLNGLLMPFGGFILLGYFAMLLKWYINKFKPEYNEETAVKIKHAPVKLHSEKEESASEPLTLQYGSAAAFPSQRDAEESSREMEFLFGSEPEEVEIFKEFWQPPDITTESITEDMDTLAKKHEQYKAETDSRLENLFRELDEQMEQIHQDFGTPSAETTGQSDPKTVEEPGKSQSDSQNDNHA